MPAPRLPHPPALTGSDPTISQMADDSRCPACGGGRVTEIGMTLTDGSPVRFWSCRGCEAKSWEQGGDSLPLAEVMDKARKPQS